MATTPAPSMLYLISQLSGVPVGEKVRFLGCVESYSNGVARITHARKAVDVDVDHVLHVSRELLDVGAWVNVIGYTVAPKRVQATMLWSAGNMGPSDEYVAGVHARQGM